MQAIAELNGLMHGEAREDGDASGTVSPVVEVLERAEKISPRMRDKLEREGRDVLEQELKVHVGEADGWAWWWMLIAFLVGVGVTVGGGWAWNALGLSVSVPF